MVKPENQQYSGKRLSEIAEMMHKDWADAAMDLISSEHSRVETMFFIASEDNLKLQIRQPWIKFGTDASGHGSGDCARLGASASLWQLSTRVWGSTCARNT